jgi:hypothetical protein
MSAKPVQAIKQTFGKLERSQKSAAKVVNN